jgi:hypothetical protein
MHPCQPTLPRPPSHSNSTACRRASRSLPPRCPRTLRWSSRSALRPAVEGQRGRTGTGACEDLARHLPRHPSADRRGDVRLTELWPLLLRATHGLFHRPSISPTSLPPPPSLPSDSDVPFRHRRQRTEEDIHRRAAHARHEPGHHVRGKGPRGQSCSGAAAAGLQGTGAVRVGPAASPRMGQPCCSAQSCGAGRMNPPSLPSP